jgi:effector-binding domain-containing protein
MNYQCKIIDEKTTHHVLVINKTTTIEEMPKVLSECYSRIKGYLNGIGEIPVGAPFVAFHNDDVEKLEIEVGLTVGKRIKGEKDILARDIPGGKKVSCVHVGTYEEIEPNHDTIRRWMEEHHYKPKGVSYEFYVDDPLEVAEGKMQTKVVFPLAQEK